MYLKSRSASQASLQLHHSSRHLIAHGHFALVMMLWAEEAPQRRLVVRCVCGACRVVVTGSWRVVVVLVLTVLVRALGPFRRVMRVGLVSRVVVVVGR